MVLLPGCKCCGGGGPSLPCTPAYTGSPGDCLSSGFTGKYYKNLKVELITERPWTIKPYVLSTCTDENLLESWYQPEYSEYYLPFDPSRFGSYEDSLKVQNPIGPMGSTIDLVRGDADLNCIPDPSFLLFYLNIKDMRYEIGPSTPCHSPVTDWTNEFCDRCFNDTAAADYWERRVRFDPATVEEQPDLLKRILQGERVLLPAEGECRNTVYCTGGSSPCAPAINSQIAGYVTGFIAVSMSCGPCWSCYRYNNKTEVYTVNNNVHEPPDAALRIDDRCYETKEDAEEGCDGDYCCYVKNNGETVDDYQCVNKSDPTLPSPWRNTYQCTDSPEECAENCKPCWNLWRSPQTECRKQDTSSWFESPLLEYLRYEPKPGFEDNAISSDMLEGIPEGTNIPVNLYSSGRCDYEAEYQSPIQEECENWQFMTSMTSLRFVLEKPGYSENLELNRRTYSFEIYGNQDFKTTKGECLRGVTYRYQEFRQPLGAPHPKEFIMSFMVEDAMTRQEQGEVFYKLTFRPGVTMYRYRCLTKEQPDPNSGEPDGYKTWEIVSECNATQDECESGIPTTTGDRTMPTTQATTGPGTHLKNMLGWVGIRAKEKGCKCGHMEKKMNQGPQWCRDHKEEILAHLATEAKKRGLPFVRMAAGKLVDLAIRRADIRK